MRHSFYDIYWLGDVTAHVTVKTFWQIGVNMDGWLIHKHILHSHAHVHIHTVFV